METKSNIAYPEEVSLRELIDVLIKGRKIILVITLMALLVSAVFSFLIIQPVYEAEAFVQYKPMNVLKSSGNSNMKLDGISIEDDVDTLMKLIMHGSNTIEQEVSYLVALLADMSDFNSGIIAERLKDKEMLDIAFTDTGIDKADTNKFSISVATDKTNIIGIKVSGEDARNCALLANRLAENVEGIYRDEATKRIESAKGFVLNSMCQIEDSILEFENDLYQDAGSGQTADKAKLEYQLINAKIAYNEFVKQEIFLDLAGEIDYGKTAVQVISTASASSVPVSPNKPLNLAIAGVLGLMLAVFVVFIREYWEKTGGDTGKV